MTNKLKSATTDRASKPTPVVGSAEYKALDFKTQLEIASSKLFTPTEYAQNIGEAVQVTPTLPETDFPTFVFDPPSNKNAIPKTDLPVAFLNHHWAVYTAKFQEKWYLIQANSRGVTPLDHFGIKWEKLVNSFTFNFSIMVLNQKMHQILEWYTKHISRDQVHPDTLLDVCKVYAFLMSPDTLEAEWPTYFNKATKLLEIDYFQFVHLALNKYHKLHTFDDLNGEFPVIEPCESLYHLECNDYLAYNKPVRRNGEFYYPLVPAGLYTVDQFKIYNWGLLEK